MVSKIFRKEENENRGSEHMRMSKEERLKQGLYFVGEIAHLTGVLPSHIAFYTREGLLRVHSTTQGGYNLYEREEAIQRLSAIKELQEQDCALEEIKLRLGMVKQPDSMKKRRIKRTLFIALTSIFMLSACAIKIFAATTDKDMTLQSATTNSPQLKMQDKDSKTLTLQKQDAGEADIINNEGQINVKPSNDTTHYVYFYTDSNLPEIFWEGIAATNDPGLRVNGASGKMEYRDQNNPGWNAFADISGTGANTALSNLASVAINASLLPGTTNSIDLGSTAKTFKDAYITGNVGIGTTAPAQKLDVNGTVQMAGFKLSTSPTNGYVLTSDASGVGTWAAASGGANTALSNLAAVAINTSLLPGTATIDLGSAANTFRNAYLSGNLGIGTTAPGYKLDVNGDVNLGTSVLRVAGGLGSNGQVLTTNGTTVSWATVSSVSQTPWTSNINAAGYTLNGNTSPSGNLTLESTSDVTKGYVLLNPTGGNVGIGTTAPAQKLDVSGTAQMTGFKLTTSPTNGYVLTSDAAGVGTWAAASSGGANTALSNLASVAISQSLTPGTDNSIDLGSAAKTFKDAYLTGKVGIGTTNPTVPLEVNGQVKIGAYTLPSTDGSSGNILSTNGSGTVSWAAAGGGTVTGSGTQNYLPKWATTTSLGDSVMSQVNKDVTLDGTLIINRPAQGDGGHYPTGSFGMTINNADLNGKMLRFQDNAVNPPLYASYFNEIGAYYSALWVILSGTYVTGVDGDIRVIAPTSDATMLSLWADGVGPAFQIRPCSGVGSYNISSLDKDAKYTWRLDTDGKMEWGVAATANNEDTNLYRNAAGVLRTSGSFIADSKIGIGTTAPATTLDVNGTATMSGFKLTTSPTNGYVLTSDASGVGSWTAAGTGTVTGSGTTNYLPKFTGSTALGDSLIYESSGKLGIGTTIPAVLLSVGANSNQLQTGHSAAVNIRPTDDTATDGNSYTGLIVTKSALPAGSSSSFFYGAEMQAVSNPTSTANITLLNGTYNIGDHKGSGTVANLIGAQNISWANSVSSGNIEIATGAYNVYYNDTSTDTTTAYGAWDNIRNGSGTITNAYTQQSRLRNSGGRINNAYNYYSSLPINTGTIGTFYGAYFSSPTGTITNKYAIVTESGAGNVGIGTTDPASALDVNGTATITGFKLSTSPTNGYVLTSDAAGVGTWQAASGGSQTPWASNINAAGYTLNGNTSPSGNLTLESTSDVTKGYVLLNPTGGNVGIGTTLPSNALDVNGTVDLHSGLTKYTVISPDMTEPIMGLAHFTTFALYDHSTGVAFAEIGRGNHPQLSLPINAFVMKSASGDGGNIISLQNSDGNDAILLGTISDAPEIDMRDTSKAFLFKVITGAQAADRGIIWPVNVPSAGEFLKVNSITNYQGTNLAALEWATVSSGGWTNSASVIYNTIQTDKVGIGTTTPSDLLDVAGGVKIGTGYAGGGATAPSSGLIVQGAVGIGTYLVGTAKFAVLGGNVGIGTTGPASALDVNGTAQMTGFKLTASPTNGYVLTSDAAGVGSWQAASSVSQTPWTSNINAAGYTLNGNTSPSGNLTLDSTSNATKGNVLLNPTGGNVGIGTTGPTHFLTVTGAIKTDGTQNILNVNGTLPASPSAVVTGVNFNLTSAGSASYSQRGIVGGLSAGYTGSSATFGADFYSNAAGTGNYQFVDGQYIGNMGFRGTATATTTGTNVGGIGYARGGNINIGGNFAADDVKSGATNIGLAGEALDPTGSGKMIGGLFRLGQATTTFASTALLVDNGSIAAPIFIARDNGTEKVRIDDGGNVGIGNTSPQAPLHVTSTSIPAIVSYDATIVDPTTADTTTTRFLSLYGNVGLIGHAASNGGNNLFITMKGGDPAYGAITFQTGDSPTEKMRIAKAGNVGIGTTNPTSMLSVGATSQFQVNTSGNIVKLNNATTTFPSSNASGVLTNDGVGTLTWSAASTGTVTGSGIQNYITKWNNAGGTAIGNSLVYDNGTNVGIGTTSPSNHLDIYTGGSGALLTDGLRITRAATTNFAVINDYNGGLNILSAYNNDYGDILFTQYKTIGSLSRNPMYINPSGNVGIGTTIPSEKLSIYGGAVIGATYASANTAPTNGLLVQGNVGINTTSPGANLEVKSAIYISTPSTAANNWAENRVGSGPYATTNLWISEGQSSAGTTGTDTSLSNDALSILYTGSAAKGLVVRTSTGPIAFKAQGDGTQAAQMYFATSGNVGIGTTNPTSMLSVGATSQFQVNTSGNIVKLNNATTTFPSSNASGVLTNDGAGTLTWAAAGGSQTPWTSNINAAGYTLNGNTSPSENLTLDSTSNATKGYVLLNPTSGNVGINTTAPSSTLHVVGNETLFGTLGMATSASSTFQTLTITAGVFATGTSTINSANTTNLRLYTQTNPGIFLDTAGNVEIGSTAPSLPLGVQYVNTATAFTTLDPTTGGLEIYNYTDAINRGAMLVLSSNYNGTNKTSRAAIKAIEETQGGNAAGSLVFFTNVAGSSNSLSESMRINSSQNVGIGTAAPQNKLDISGGAVIGAGYAGVSTAPSNGLLVKGKVGIGTSTPATLLQIFDGATGAANSEMLNLQTSYGATGQKAITWRDNANITGQIDSRYDGTYVNMAFGHLYSGGYTTTDVLYLRGDGHVGIGTTAPLNKLDIAGNAVIGAGYAGIAPSAPANGLLVQGSVGIGTTTPATALDVNGAATVRTGGSANKAMCWKSDGVTLGYCSTIVGADGSCTCN